MGAPEKKAGELITGNKELAQMLNQWFASVFTVETVNIPEKKTDKLISINKEKFAEI